MSLPKYPECKDSGTEWLGDVPEHWKTYRLQDIAQVINGYPFDSKLFDVNGAFPLIRIRDLDARETATRYSGDFLEAASVTFGDVLIGMDGDFNVGRWLGKERALLNQRMCCVRTNSRALATFLRHALPIPLKAINNVTYATTVKHLSSFDVEKIRLALPDQAELTHVSEFLDRETAKIDALIAEQEKLLALLAEKRQASITHAVTRGLDPAAPMKDSGISWLGKVPANWDLVPCRALVSERVEKNDDGENEDYLSLVANVGVMPYAEKGDVGNRKPDDLRKCKLVEVGDLVINSMNYGIGSYGLSRYRGICSPVYIVLCAFHERSIKEFVYRVFQNRAFQVFAQSFGNGILAHRAAISWDIIKNLRIAVPTLSEQRDIVTFIEKVEEDSKRVTVAVEQAIGLLQERRSALIAAAVTGKIDVRDVAERVAA